MELKRHKQSRRRGNVPLDIKHTPERELVVRTRREREEAMHQPADGMQIRREKILAIERVTIDSPVGRAIAVQRAIDRAVGR